MGKDILGINRLFGLTDGTTRGALAIIYTLFFCIVVPTSGYILLSNFAIDKATQYFQLIALYLLQPLNTVWTYYFAKKDDDIIFGKKKRRKK